ncbi:hypothetical protein [Salinigranum salinum]|uniref:hypothetical protein n=1 Tax=Salinigranum salinum TaxID=1364937 RepID=UPI0019590E1D|nr:hypothetical protein [Salinigranum salinum]
MMRLRMPESRKRLYKRLLEATGESTKSKALDRAARYYCEMRGDTAVVPVGAIGELLAAAEERGSLTGEEIAAILDCQWLRVEYETEWLVGDGDNR